MWPVHPLAAEVRLAVTRDMPPLSSATESSVARHWAAATACRPLFNGRIFCADRITPALIEGHWSEYRRLTAQIADPGLFAALQVRSLAVCGAVSGPDGLAVGRREPLSAYQPGLWQLPPAGSVDGHAAVPGGADWSIALLRELREELGVLASDVIRLRPLCLVQHPSGVLDMGVRIDTTLDRRALLARHEASGDQEYDRLLVVPPEALEAEVAALQGQLVPSAAIFRDHAMRLPS